jgi:NAD(P)-dependent dehydrogenase (short-subunit alcohol dehydrogenase family)
MRAVVVGASSGLGRCIGVGLARRGAQVALLARRADRLRDAVVEAGDAAVALECDVTDEIGCRAAIDAAAQRLGGVDALVYAAGVAPLSRIEDLEVASWRAAFDTNVIGASIATAAALPHLLESHGRAAYLASHSASLTAPWPFLAAYGVSKAALDRLVEAWSAEHPTVGFTRVVIGDCRGGEGGSQVELGARWERDLAVQAQRAWAERGLLSEASIDVEELVDLVDLVLRARSTAAIPEVAVLPLAQANTPEKRNDP